MHADCALQLRMLTVGTEHLTGQFSFAIALTPRLSSGLFAKLPSSSPGTVNCVSMLCAQIAVGCDKRGPRLVAADITGRHPTPTWFTELGYLAAAAITPASSSRKSLASPHHGCCERWLLGRRGRMLLHLFYDGALATNMYAYWSPRASRHTSCTRRASHAAAPRECSSRFISSTLLSASRLRRSPHAQSSSAVLRLDLLEGNPIGLASPAGRSCTEGQCHHQCNGESK